MGCSSSSAVNKRPVVSERDAFDIAGAWHDQLRGCVRVEMEPTTEQLPSSIIPMFEWIVFVFNGTLHQGFRPVVDPQKTAAYARAATIAWFALSCCEGYSGAENPIFWSRVLSALLYPTGLPPFSRHSSYPTRPQRPMTEAVRFFSHWDKPFPRIKLAVGPYDEDATIESVFFGRVLHEDKERDTKLQRILTKLQPFMRVSIGRRRVPVEIELLTPPTTKPATHLRNAPSGGEMTTEATVSVASLMDFPQLYLRSVMIIDTHSLPVDGLHSMIPPSDVEVCVGGDLPRFIHDHQLCSGLLDQIQANAPEHKLRRWCVNPLRVVQNSELSYSYLSVLCSALPHLQSVSTVTLPGQRYFSGTPRSIASDWAWMGYAVFHPDAASTSGLTGFVADVRGMTPADIAALAKMTGGNNLLGDINTGYLEGRVRCGTEVRKRPVDDHEPRLHTFPAESWVALCVPALDALEHEDWLCVVVPGFGSGWIHRDNIIATRSRRPGVSCIRVLSVNGYSEDANEETLMVLIGLLGVLGDQLTSLLFKNSDHISASTVQAILQLCPSLKSLCIRHDGSVWADEASAMKLPRLEELELTISGANTVYHPLQELKPACLPHLKALRVISIEEGSAQQHHLVLVSCLLNQPVLQYLNWSRGYDMIPTWVDSLSLRKNEATRNFQLKMPYEYYFSHGPLHLNCRLAFLSVMGDNAGRSSLARLGEDVVALIFQHIRSSSPREVFINRDVSKAGYPY